MRLIDADAVIEKCGDWYVEEGPEEGFIGTLKSLIDEQPTVSGWISVKDRLPEEKENWITRDWQKVICCCDFGGDPRRIDVRTYSFGKAHFWHGPQIMDGVVTHWQYLPEPPKEDDGDEVD